MKNLRYICVQPRLFYYSWQVEVMINNFIKHGINPNNIDILVAWNPNDLTTSVQANVDAWEKLKAHYSSVRFFFYQDTREQPIHYISSVRPNILKQHFQAYPELENEAIFYHDCDIVLTKQPDWDKFLHDSVWYLSNTNSYINFDYIMSKGYDVYSKMCEIVEIPEIIPKLMNSNSGGAQYILKNIDDTFWENVERDCENLFRKITQLNNKKKQENPSYHELQIWAADMWSVLWNIWKCGYTTQCHPDLMFSWGSSSEDFYNSYNIMHNAGITNWHVNCFNKSKYKKSLPYNLNLKIKENTASKKYYEWVQKTEKKSVLLKKNSLI